MNDDRKYLENMLIGLGIMPNLKGFEMICSAVLLVKSGIKIMSFVYEKVADEYSTTSHCVERNIRTAKDKSSFCKHMKNSEFVFYLEWMMRKENDR